jgi:hypothetical protein
MCNNITNSAVYRPVINTISPVLAVLVGWRRYPGSLPFSYRRIMRDMAESIVQRRLVADAKDEKAPELVAGIVWAFSYCMWGAV